MTGSSVLTMPEATRSDRASADADLVLIVDDQARVRMLLGRMLEHSGFEVVEAANGEEALALLAAGLMPRVIVLDLWMPIVDGWEFLERATAPAPVIVISGVEEEAHPLPEPVVRFLTKPIARDDLLSAVAEACR